jgi:uncharacterized protein YodC (DUF2158 family)
VVDEDDWKKCLEGVYTGFSQGGRYVRKWFDGKTNRYTAAPNEISLVDYPALKSATFSLVKANGIVEEHPFKKIAERSDVNPESGKKKYGDVTFADEKNKKYPIDTEAHIRAAWNYINKPKNAAKYGSGDVATIKRKIIAAWKAKIDKDGPPSAKKESEKIDAYTEDELKKAQIDVQPAVLGWNLTPAQILSKWEGEEISDVLTATQCLQTIAYLYTKELAESDDGQTDSLETVIENLKNFIASEIKEADDGEVMTMAEKAHDLLKAGARHSKGDGELLQKIHDHSTSMGAQCTKCTKCGGAVKSESGGDLAKDSSHLPKAYQAHAQAIHDHTNDLGVECKCDKCNKSEGGEDMDLKKFEEIVRRQDALEAENQELTKKIAALEGKPLPAKGAKFDAAAFSKQDDTKDRDGKPIKKIDDPLEMIKMAHSEPHMYAVEKPLR